MLALVFVTHLLSQISDLTLAQCERPGIPEIP